MYACFKSFYQLSNMEETKYTYDIVAEAWNNFRQRPFFPEWFRFLVEIWKKGTILDLGCGNGRNMPHFKDNFKLIGIDYSKEMIEKAKQFAKKNDIDAIFYPNDVRELPFEDGSVDNALAIAVYHHLHPEELKSALKELHRVLNPKGEAFITVWNKMQKRFIFRKSDQKIPWKRRKDDKVFYRYYHLYTRREIRKIIENSGFEIIMEGAEGSFKKKIFSKNICILVKK